jgi:hypothetical protein
MDANEMMALYAKAQDYTNVPVKKGEMSPRERFLNIMDFKKVDRIIDNEFGYWDDTLKRWHNEGLPEWVKNNDQADIYFGFDVWQKSVPVNNGLLPLFEEEFVSDDGEHKIIYDTDRVKCQIFSNGKDSIPHYIDFPIKDRKTYLPHKAKLNPLTPGRIPENIAEIGKKVKDRNYVLSVHSGSTAGRIRDWMGFEGICTNLFDQPELLDEILADMKALYTHTAAEVVKYMHIDLVAWWEDIAYKAGPIVTPEFFIEKCGPVYRAVLDIYKKNGTRFSFVDCDGDFRLLMPAWLNNGVNIMFPLEVNAGLHPENLRRENPGVRMMGGFDKVALLEGKDAIKGELNRLKPLVNEGGFIPHVDHRVQADVTYKNYLYYLEAKRDMFSLPNKVGEVKSLQ